jgi:hypothetical protein
MAARDLHAEDNEKLLQLMQAVQQQKNQEFKAHMKIDFLCHTEAELERLVFFLEKTHPYIQKTKRPDTTECVFRGEAPAQYTFSCPHGEDQKRELSSVCVLPQEQAPAAVYLRNAKAWVHRAKPLPLSMSDIPKNKKFMSQTRKVSSVAYVVLFQSLQYTLEITRKVHAVFEDEDGQRKHEVGWSCLITPPATTRLKLLHFLAWLRHSVSFSAPVGSPKPEMKLF